MSQVLIYLYFEPKMKAHYQFLAHPLPLLVDNLREPPPLAVPDEVVLDAGDELPDVPHDDCGVRLGALLRTDDELGDVGGEDAVRLLAQLDHALLDALLAGRALL